MAGAILPGSKRALSLNNKGKELQYPGIFISDGLNQIKYEGIILLHIAMYYLHPFNQRATQSTKLHAFSRAHWGKELTCESYDS